MQKRKLKINILDIAIVIAIICAAATFVFRDTIHEIFTEPEVVTLNLTAHASNADESLKPYFQSKTANFFINTESDAFAEAKISNIVVNSKTNEATFYFTCRGYKKLGRYYTESGQRLSLGNECKFTVGEKTVSCVIESVG